MCGDREYGTTRRLRQTGFQRTRRFGEGGPTGTACRYDGGFRQLLMGGA